MGERFQGLAELVKDQVPTGFKIVQSHKCKFQGRTFMHVALTDGPKLMSLVIAAKLEGEKLNSAGVQTALANSGLPLYAAGVQRFEIAAFETREFVAYVVSDLDRPRNLSVTAGLAPAVTAYLDRLSS